jgi:hypothetical protein
MTIAQGLCDSFKAELLLAVHDFRPTGQAGASVFKIALYTSSADINAYTTSYTDTGETIGTGYTAGGVTLTNSGVTLATSSGVTTFADVTIPNATFTARGALIYNSTPKANSNANSALTNPAVCVLDFGSDKTVVAGDFIISFPTADITNAIIRIS